VDWYLLWWYYDGVFDDVSVSVGEALHLHAHGTN
jgi:hypothetical protein